MSDNWIVQNLENALKTWNDKLSEIWQLITQLVLFFVIGVMKTCGSFADVNFC